MCFVFHLASPLISIEIYFCSVRSLIIALLPSLSIYFSQEIKINFIRNFLFTDSNPNAMMGTGRHRKRPGITSRNDVREPCRAVFYGAAMTGLPLPRQYRFK
jgi:hypothetical protein